MDNPSFTNNDTRWTRAAAAVLLALVTLAGLWLRCRGLDDSLWIDELHTAWTVAGGWGGVAPRALIGNQSPLYFYLMWGVTNVGGLTETVLRLPSVLAGTLIAPATYWLVRRWTPSRAAALLAAVLAAVNPLGVEYSLEARPYALVQLSALLHVLVFAELLRTDGTSTKCMTNISERVIGLPRWSLRIAFVAGGIWLFYLHYTAALLLPAELLSYFVLRWAVRYSPTYGWRRLALDLGLIALGCLPAVAHLGEIAQRRDNWQLFVERAPLWDSLIWFPVVYSIVYPAGLLLLTAAVRGSLGWRPAWRTIAWSIGVLAASWELIPALIAWGVNEADVARLFFPRYLSVSLPAPAVIAGLLCGATAGRFGKAGQLLVIVPLALYAGDVLPQVFQGQRLAVHGEDWRAAVQFLRAHQQSDASPVLVYSNLIEAASEPPVEADLREFLLYPVSGIYRLDQAGRPLIALTLDGPPAAVSATMAKSLTSREIWAVVRGGEHEVAAVRRGWEQTLARAGLSSSEIGGVRQDEVKSFGGVTVVRLTW